MKSSQAHKPITDRANIAKVLIELVQENIFQVIFVSSESTFLARITLLQSIEMIKAKGTGVTAKAKNDNEGTNYTGMKR